MRLRTVAAACSKKWSRREQKIRQASIVQGRLRQTAMCFEVEKLRMQGYRKVRARKLIEWIDLAFCHLFVSQYELESHSIGVW